MTNLFRLHVRTKTGMINTTTVTPQLLAKRVKNCGVGKRYKKKRKEKKRKESPTLHHPRLAAQEPRLPKESAAMACLDGRKRCCTVAACATTTFFISRMRKGRRRTLRSARVMGQVAAEKFGRHLTLSFAQVRALKYRLDQDTLMPFPRCYWCSCGEIRSDRYALSADFTYVSKIEEEEYNSHKVFTRASLVQISSSY